MGSIIPGDVLREACWLLKVVLFGTVSFVGKGGSRDGCSARNCLAVILLMMGGTLGLSFLYTSTLATLELPWMATPMNQQSACLFLCA